MKRKIAFLLLLIISTSILPTTIVHSTIEKTPVIVVFKNHPNPNLIHSYNGEIMHAYTIIPGIACLLPEQAINALMKNPQIQYIEPDFPVEAFQDTLPWGVDRIDAEIVWGGNEKALDVTGNAGLGIQVAVLDTGIDYTHPDLDENYIGGYDFVNGDNDPLDDNGHGTHVSGTIAAEDNGVGVLGVAPLVDLLAVKVLDARGSGSTAGVIAGIEWAVDAGAEVISMSLGSSSYSSSLEAACDAAYNSGVLIVASAGNNGDGNSGTTEVNYPAAYGSVIAVSATNSGDGIASFSNSGSFVEIAAPGVNILSTMPTYDVTLTSTGPPPRRYSNNYDDMSGTSMACPHVSGVAALVFATGKTATEVRSILSSTAENIGLNSNDQGSGLVDAEKAAAGPIEPVTDIAITEITAPSSVIQGALVDVSVTVKNVGNQDVGAFTVSLYDGLDTLHTWSVTGLIAGGSTTLTYAWDTTGASISDHVLKAVSGFPDDDSSNDQKSTVVTVTDPSLPDPTMHVGDLTSDKKVIGRSGKWQVHVTVTIHNENHQPVSGATVFGSWSGAISGTVSGTTESDGSVTLSTGNLSGGTSVTFAVTGVTHSTLTYEPANNDVDPSITVTK